MNIREEFHEIISGWVTLSFAVEGLTKRIKRVDEWAKINGPLSPDEQAAIDVMVKALKEYGVSYEKE